MPYLSRNSSAAGEWYFLAMRWSLVMSWDSNQSMSFWLPPARIILICFSDHESIVIDRTKLNAIRRERRDAASGSKSRPHGKPRRCAHVIMYMHTRWTKMGGNTISSMMKRTDRSGRQVAQRQNIARSRRLSMYPTAETVVAAALTTTTRPRPHQHHGIPS